MTENIGPKCQNGRHNPLLQYTILGAGLNFVFAISCHKYNKILAIKSELTFVNFYQLKFFSIGR